MERHAFTGRVLRRETRESLFLLGLTALVSGASLGMALLAVWSLG